MARDEKGTRGEKKGEREREKKRCAFIAVRVYFVATNDREARALSFRRWTVSRAPMLDSYLS